MSEEGYNGWTNYETWGAALILDNDESTYRETRDRAEELAEEHEDREDAIREFEEYLSDFVETLCGLTDTAEEIGIPEPTPMVRQLLNLGAIDYREIAENYLSELD